MKNIIAIRSRLDQSVCTRLALLVLVAVAGFLLHLPSELGMSLAIPPDSNEYAIGLAGLFEHGTFGFSLNGEWHPSRYAPWFSLFCLSPAYILFGCDVLTLHWSVLAFALAFLVISYYMAKLAGLGKWSFLCAILPLFIPDFVFYSRMAMTEIPYTALFAASALLFVRLVDEKSPSLRFCLGAGAIVAWCGTVRVTALPMLVLFVVALLAKRRGWRKKIVSVLVLCGPAVVYEIAVLSYNWRVFGSLFRSGYNYWVPVPYDFTELTFSVDLAIRNATRYLHEPLVVITLILVAIVVVVTLLIMHGLFGGRRENKNFLLLSGYVLFQGAVLFSLYVGYYYYDERFFLPVALCSVPLSFAALARMTRGLGVKIASATLVCAVIVVVQCFRVAQPEYSYMAVGYPFRIVEAKMTSAVIPYGSVVIIEGNPCMLDHFGFREKRLELFPINRDFDYVRDMYALASISKFEPRPKAYTQLIVPEIVASGACVLPFPDTFEENPERVKMYLKENRRVFLQRGVACNPNTEESKRIFATLDRMGLTAREFGVWSVPEIRANPVRHLYDRIVFPGFSMDSRSEVKSVYYEISPKH